MVHSIVILQLRRPTFLWMRGFDRSASDTKPPTKNERQATLGDQTPTTLTRICCTPRDPDPTFIAGEIFLAMSATEVVRG